MCCDGFCNGVCICWLKDKFGICFVVFGEIEFVDVEVFLLFGELSVDVGLFDGKGFICMMELINRLWLGIVLFVFGNVCCVLVELLCYVG